MQNRPLTAIDTTTDLGITRTSDSAYSKHCEVVASKATKVAGAIRKIVRSRVPQLMWPAFQYYVLPIVSYCSPVWNPVLRQNINLIEHVQCRYTKSIRGLRDLTYSDRLSSLGALTLENQTLE